jgi:hypothetical protein
MYVLTLKKKRTEPWEMEGKKKGKGDLVINLYELGFAN